MLTPEQASRLDADVFQAEEDGVGGDAAEAPLPERIGKYDIMRLIASGGMGTVYLAVQEHPRRQVALKVLRSGVASHAAMRRFEHEVGVLAHLRHPGIAQIHEAGTHDNGSGAVPYFAMEFVPNARPITRYAEDHMLGVPLRLVLFAQVCDAVHYGHQKGVIHRDLKPENILVGLDPDAHPKRPEVKVIDFGIARATDSDLAVTTLHTDVKAFMGTLQYMSPEQCDVGPAGIAHDLDTRSDVYSLGVVLYQLLTGHVPYDVSHKTMATAIRLVQEAEPPPPSRFNRSLRGDLDTIILKAINKDREKRYVSAASLAEEIRRHLAGDSIEARPPTGWARATRWVTRHPLLGTGIACLAIAATSLLLTAGGVWWYARKPHELEVSADGYEVRLRSVGGHLLHVWRTKGELMLAALVDRPRQFGDGKLAAIACGKWDDPLLPPGVAAFDVAGDRQQPVWTGTLDDSDLPAALRQRGFTADAFGVRHAAVYDIFPDLDHPGDEILVTHQHPQSACALRIYDLRGEVLYQVWHDGPVAHSVWLPGAATLILSGLNTEAMWHERGVSADIGRHPCVTFAIRPQLGFRTTDWIKTSGHWGSVAPYWYKGLLLNEWADVVYDLLVEPARPDQRPAGFVVNVRLRSNPDSAVTVLFDASGQEVGEREPNNTYRADLAAGRAPPVDSFTFGQLPPVLHERQEARPEPPVRPPGRP